MAEEETLPTETSLLALWSRNVDERTLREGSPLASYRPAAADGSPRPAAGPAFVRGSRLAEGGMGVIFKGMQCRLGREVALKTLRPGRRGPAERADFVAEALVNGRLEHPNIVPVHDLDVDENGEAFLAMKLVGGKSWAALLGEGSVLDRDLDILLHVGHAVGFAHSRNIVHNDLKPANVMVGDFGEILVMDWGLALSLESPPPPGLRGRSGLSGAFGTPGYMAPELANGDTEGVGAHTDIFLLGAILYRVLAGRAPWTAGGNLLQCIVSAARCEPPPLPEDAPRELAAICRRAMARDPDARFPSVAAFQDALRAYLGHRQSVALSDRAGRALAELARDDAELASSDRLYMRFAEAVSSFEQALSLWEENPDALQGVWEARYAYARAALDRADLGLARALLDELDGERDPPRRAGLERALEHARQRRERERSSRRRLLVALCTTLVALFAGLAGGLYVISSNAAELARQKANADRRGAVAQAALEDLVDNVQQRLLDELGEQRAQELARELLVGARDGWQALREADLAAADTGVGSALVRLRLGRLYLSAQDDERALAEIRGAIDQLDELLRSDSAPALRLLGAEAFVALGAVHGARGEPSLAGPILERAFDALDAAAERPPALVAEALAELAAVRRDQLRLAEADSLLARAVEVRAEERRARPGDARTLYAFVDTALAHGEVLLERDRLDAASARAESCRAALAPLLAGGAPLVADARRALGVDRLRAEVAIVLAEPDAPTRCDALIADARALLARDPRNRRSVLDLMRAIEVAVWLPYNAGRIGEARVLFEELQSLSPATWPEPERPRRSQYLAIDVLSLFGSQLALEHATDASRACLEAAVALCDGLLARDPGNHHIRLRRADVWRMLARRQWQTEAVQERAEAAWAELASLPTHCASPALDLTRGRLAMTLAGCAIGRGELDASRHWAARSLAYLDRIDAVTTQSDALRVQAGIAYASGDLDGASRLYEQALRRLRAYEAETGAPCDQSIAAALEGLAALCETRGDHVRAQALFDECRARIEALVARDEGNREAYQSLAWALGRLGSSAAYLDDVPQARRCYERAVAVLRELHAATPTHVSVAQDLIVTLGELGEVELLGLRGESACARLEEALATLETFPPVPADDLRWLVIRGVILVQLAECELFLARLDDAAEHARRGLPQLAAVHQAFPRDPTKRLTWVWARGVAGRIAARQRDLDRARALLTDPVEGLPAPAARTTRALARLQVHVGDTLAALGRLDAEIERNRSDLAERPSQRGELHLAAHLLETADLFVSQRELSAARMRAEEAAALLADHDGPTAAELELRGRLLGAQILHEEGDPAEALERIAAITADLDAALARWPEHLPLVRQKVWTLVEHARLLLVAGDPGGARALLEEAMALQRAHLSDAVGHDGRCDELQVLTWRGDAEDLAGDEPAALATRREEVALARALVAADSLSSTQQFALGSSLVKLGELLLRGAGFAAARALFAEARGAFDEVVALGPVDAKLWSRAAKAWLGDAFCARGSGDFARALASCERAHELALRALALDPWRAPEVESIASWSEGFRHDQRRFELFTGQRAPETAEDWRIVALDQAESGAFIDAVESYRRGIDDEATPRDVLTAARAASQAAALVAEEERAGFEQSARRWLGRWLRSLARDLAADPGLAPNWTYIRDEDPELDHLRGTVGFRALFREAAEAAGIEEP